jgi:uncharacterized protein YcbX
MSASDSNDDTAVSLESVHVYPVKSCAGTTPGEALLIETGFDLDRAWMVVDAAGEFVTQRELPRMALIQPTLKLSEMILRAPACWRCTSPSTGSRRPARRRCERHGRGVRYGALCAQWFSDFLGRPLRLARFDPETRRLANRQWTGTLESEISFQDGFPLLVASSASLAEVNRRLALAGETAVTMARFRPSLVLGGLDAHGEDHLDEIRFETAEGPVRLKLVKPCARCPIPDVDPATGVAGHVVGDVLAQYRADRRLDGALTFGMNAIVVEGMEEPAPCVCRAGRASPSTDGPCIASRPGSCLPAVS